jgi:hypothetical protein
LTYSDILLDLWRDISPRDGYAFSYKKIDDTCSTDLNVGISSDGKKCVVLVLPADFTDHASLPGLYTPINRLNIEFRFHEGRELILLLKDDFYFKEFLEFIETLIPKILSVDEYQSPSIFIETLISWLEMFDPSSKNGLSDSEVLGLLAELLILERELDSSPSLIDSILDGWRGPYHYSKDFELEDRYLEVKYKNEPENSVHISSEFQLSIEGEKPVYLTVVTGRRDPIEGVTLSELNKKIRLKIRASNGDMSIYLRAMSQLGVTQERISYYNSIKVIFLQVQIFDASLLNFPSIQKKNLQEAISRVTYKIDTRYLDEFSLQKDYL